MLTKWNMKLSIAAGLLCLVTNAGVYGIEFKNLGPGGGGTAGTLAVDPNHPEIAYIGLDCGGMHVTRDGGKTWANSNAGINNDGNVDWNNHHASIVLPSGRAICSSVTGGIFVSDDQGATWQAMFRTPVGVKCFYVNPHNPKIVYAGIGHNDSVGATVPPGPYKAPAGEGLIFVNTNDGQGEWQRLDTDPNDYIPSTATILSLAVSYSDPKLMYAATDHGAYRSRDGGKSWTSIQSLLKNAVPRKIVTVPGKPNVVYVATGYLDPKDTAMRSGVYRSLDCGDTWKPLCRGLLDGHTAFNNLVADPHNPNVMYLGCTDWGGALYRSTDGGANWSILFDGNTLANDPKQGGVHNWIWHPELHHVSVGGGLCVAGKDADNDGLTDSIWFVGDNVGIIWNSTDGGRTWQQKTTQRTKVIDGLSFYSGRGEMELACGRRIIVDPRNSDHLWVQDFDWGIWESVDRGESWRLTSGPWYQGELLGAGVDTILDPDNPDIIYNASWGVLRRLPGKDMCIWAGRPEFNDGLPKVRASCLLIVNGKDKAGGYKYLYLATEENGVYRLNLRNPKARWENVSKGLGLLPDGKAPTWRLARIPNTRGLYCTGPTGIYRSDDGLTWMLVGGTDKLNKEVAYARNIATDPKRPSWIYASVMSTFFHQPGDGLFLSKDYGKTWEKLAYLEIPYIVLADPLGSEPAALVASQTHGLYRVAQDPQTGKWTTTIIGDKSNGLDHTRVWTVVADPQDPKRLYLGTHGGFIYTGTR